MPDPSGLERGKFSTPARRAAIEELKAKVKPIMIDPSWAPRPPPRRPWWDRRFRLTPKRRALIKRVAATAPVIPTDPEQSIDVISNDDPRSVARFVGMAEGEISAMTAAEYIRAERDQWYE